MGYGCVDEINELNDSCEGISPLGYWQEVNQSSTQTKPYNIDYKYRPTKQKNVLGP